MRNLRGITLIELMVTLTVGIILLAVGVPLYQSVQANNSVVTQANTLLVAFKLARSEAVTRSIDVSICARDYDPAAPTDYDCGTDWTEGWLVFEDSNSNSDIDGGELLFRAFGPPSGDPTIAGGAAIVVYQDNGTSTAQVFSVSQANATSGTRCVRINAAGQIRMNTITTGTC